MSEDNWTEFRKVEDITDEIQSLVTEIVRGWYPEGCVDWEDVWDRADGSRLDDGTRLDLGIESMSPGMKALKKKALEER